MTIALTPFTGFCGFRPLSEISHFLSTVPELATLLGSSAQAFQTSFSKSASEGKEALKQLFATLMNSREEDIAAQAELLVDRAKNDGSFGEDGELAKLLVQLDLQFPKDVGLFCALFLNYVKLNPGEAMFLRARDVHAYISGGPFLPSPTPSPHLLFSFLFSLLDRVDGRRGGMHGRKRQRSPRRFDPKIQRHFHSNNNVNIQHGPRLRPKNAALKIPKMSLLNAIRSPDRGIQCRKNGPQYRRRTDGSRGRTKYLGRHERERKSQAGG